MPDLQNLRQKGFEPRRKENDKTSAFLPFLCVWRVKGNVRVSVLSLQSLALYNSLGNFVKTVNKSGIFQNDVYDNFLLASEIYIQQCALFRLIMVILELPKGFPPKKVKYFIASIRMLLQPKITRLNSTVVLITRNTPAVISSSRTESN